MSDIDDWYEDEKQKLFEEMKLASKKNMDAAKKRYTRKYKALYDRYQKKHEAETKKTAKKQQLKHRITQLLYPLKMKLRILKDKYFYKEVEES